MTQTTIEIHNPTGSSVTYLSRGVRLRAPSGRSRHIVSHADADLLRDHFKAYAPRVTVTGVPAPDAPAETADAETDPAEDAAGDDTETTQADDAQATTRNTGRAQRARRSAKGKTSGDEGDSA